MPNLMIVRNDYPDAGALKRVLDYAMDTPLHGGYAIDSSYAFPLMMLVKKVYHKTEGVQLKHFILSFSDEDILHLDFEELLQLGFQIGKVFAKYQLVYGIHLDTDNVHMHFVMNTVSFTDGQKYADGIHGFYKICDYLRDQFPGGKVAMCPSESWYGK